LALAVEFVHHSVVSVQNPVVIAAVADSRFLLKSDCHYHFADVPVSLEVVALVMPLFSKFNLKSLRIFPSVGFKIFCF